RLRAVCDGTVDVVVEDVVVEGLTTVEEVVLVVVLVVLEGPIRDEGRVLAEGVRVGSASPEDVEERDSNSSLTEPTVERVVGPLTLVERANGLAADWAAEERA